MRYKTFGFRAANQQVHDWLAALPPRMKSRVINNAIREHMLYEKTGEDAQNRFEHLINLRNEMSSIGRNINQIAKAVNIAALNGEQAKGLDQLEYMWEELRKLVPEVRKAIRHWR